MNSWNDLGEHLIGLSIEKDPVKRLKKDDE